MVWEGSANVEDMLVCMRVYAGGYIYAGLMVVVNGLLEFCSARGRRRETVVVDADCIRRNSRIGRVELRREGGVN